MALKLFRTTEYSTSSLFTHTRPQAGVGPAALLVLSALWLAGPGNLVLWMAVAGGTQSAGGVLVAVALALAVAAFDCAVLSVLAWRRLLKFAITLMFALSAAGTWWLLAEAPSLADGAAGSQPWTGWQRLLAIIVVFVMPLLLVWRQTVRIVIVRRQFASNVIVLGASLAVLAGVLAVAGQDLRALVRYEPGWACMINPAAPLVRLSGHCTPPART